MKNIWNDFPENFYHWFMKCVKLVEENNYEVGQYLDNGCASSTYLCKHKVSDKKYAVKFVYMTADEKEGTFEKVIIIESQIGKCAYVRKY